MVDWFSGGVTEAISAYQEKKGLLVVYIHHSEGENDPNTINFNQLWEKIGNELFSEIPAIAIRLTKDSDGAKQFSEFFPTPIFPVCYVLGLNGQPLEVITAVEPLTEQRLKESLKKGIKLYADQLKEQGIEVPKAIESLNDPVIDIAGEAFAGVQGVELTEEERLQKVQYVRERLEQKRREDAEKKEEEERQKELTRIKEGKALLDAREKQKEREVLEAIEARRKEKENDALVLRKIREQIQQDKEDRKRKLNGDGNLRQEEPASVEIGPEPSKPVNSLSEAMGSLKNYNAKRLYRDFIFKVYVILVEPSGYVFQVLYALLINETQDTYERLVQEIKRIWPDFNPTSISMDFEISVINAIEVSFP